MADGGDGGDGGNGGSGGNGGITTVYYNKKSDLKNLTILALGGEPGRRADGGRYGRGCRCSKSYWYVETRKPDGSTEKERYHCEEGRDGKNGKYGKRGSKGALGIAYIVQGHAPLPAQNRYLNISIGKWAKEPIELSKRLWSPKSESSSLFSYESKLSNSYYSYEGMYRQKVNLDWQASRPSSHFYDLNALLSVVGSYPDYDVRANFSGDFWFKGFIGENKTYVITKAFKTADVKRLRFHSIWGRESQTSLFLKDTSGVMNDVDTSLRLTFSRKLFGYSVRFDKMLTRKHVIRREDGYIIKLGQLPVKKKYFKPGRIFKVSVVATRKMDNKRINFNVVRDYKYVVK